MRFNRIESDYICALVLEKFDCDRKKAFLTGDDSAIHRSRDVGTCNSDEPKTQWRRARTRVITKLKLYNMITRWPKLADEPTENNNDNNDDNISLRLCCDDKRAETTVDRQKQKTFSTGF